MHDHRLVLFDIDGTLLHSKGCGRAATRLAMQEVFGTTGVLDDVFFTGKTDWQILSEALGSTGLTLHEIGLRLDHYNQTVTRVLTEIIGDYGVTPCPGAPDILAALVADPAILVGLITGNSVGLVPVKLRAARYDPDHFKIGAFGSEGWDRAMLPPLALERAQLHSGATYTPDRIVIVGDTPLDITCAESIQARAIAVATGPYTATELAQHRPDRVFETLADTARVLDAIRRS